MGRASWRIEHAVLPERPVRPDFSAAPALNVRPTLSQMILLARLSRPSLWGRSPRKPSCAISKLSVATGLLSRCGNAVCVANCDRHHSVVASAARRGVCKTCRIRYSRLDMRRGVWNRWCLELLVIWRVRRAIGDANVEPVVYVVVSSGPSWVGDAECDGASIVAIDGRRRFCSIRGASYGK